ncbi:hypothetical protein [Janthinobacterium sp. 1_2014MBL_MicDiv]|uniref:hypothetical protein n=1 Tax=Janthinobacterium sp. 1_2014MBL_MicDiv TaxID=1644131 RepID=UPI0008F4DEA2|nr:hypothetical protein [Janthinobacterium sp. 1_2014MBL_MicDiv]APA69566.1 hypothetical protein YQ44_19255 [Janthinobacterium sp. 1_2014MBL_MicDiv]
MKASFSRTLALGSAALVLGLSSLSASALEIGEQDKVQISGKAYKLAPQEFSQYGNRYHLDTGDTLLLRQQVNRYFTQLKGQPEVELFGRAPGVFETASGTRLEFRSDADVIAITGLSQIPGAVAKAGETASTVHFAAR